MEFKIRAYYTPTGESIISKDLLKDADNMGVYVMPIGVD